MSRAQSRTSTPTKGEWDAVTLKILWDRLVSTTFEVGRTLERAAFSIVVREGKDYAVVITDVQGNCVAQPSDCTPVFLGTLPVTLRHLLAQYPVGALAPGDSLITNDPWLGTGHLSDISIASPIFDAAGRAIAFVATTAHMTDIGGRIDFGATREIYEEGLRIPAMKLEMSGKVNADLINLIHANVRVPDGVVGDIMAMLAANRVAAERVADLVEQAGIGDLTALSHEIVSRSEGAMRAAISEVPAGEYRASISGDGFVGPFTVNVLVVVDGDEIRVDFAGSSAQTESSLNAVIAYTKAFSMYTLKCLLSPRLPNNEGTFRPFTIAAPPGSVLNALEPVAVNNRNLVGHFIAPAIMRALAAVIPDRVIADSGSTPAQFETFTGLRADGRPFVQFFGHNGGMGASCHHDGELACFPSNMGTTPVEIVETQAPLLVREKMLLTNSAGAGRYRGGFGQRVTTRNLASTGILHNAMPCRLNYPARGILGGLDAGVYRILINGVPRSRPQGTWILQPGDEVTVEYPGGAGYGNPIDRRAEAIVEDMKDGLLTEAIAREAYGTAVEQRPLAQTESISANPRIPG